MPQTFTDLTLINNVGRAIGITEIKAALDALATPTVSAPTDGWTDDSRTWVYATASTFTIAGVDLTTAFGKGTRLRLKQGGSYKYFVVVGSAFSTNTTVTVAVNNDHTLANAAITDNDYSYEASPQGYPGWFNYTPTYTGFTGAVTTSMAKYSIVGTQCVINYYFNGTSNANFMTATIPVVSADSSLITSCYIQDNGAGLAAQGRCASGGTNLLTFAKDNTGNVFTTSGGKGASGQLTVSF